MRRSWIIGLCATLLGGIAGAAEKADDGWKTYRNVKFGYEFSYPAAMAYTAYVDGSSGELKDARTGERLVDFQVWPPDECPRQPAATLAREVGIERAKTITQADGPDGSSYCGDPVTVREYTARQGATIYELDLTCWRESYPISHDDTDDGEPDAAPREVQPVISAEGNKGPTYFVDISPPWRKRNLLADPVGADPRVQGHTGKLDPTLLHAILQTLETFPTQKPPGVCVEDLPHRGFSIGIPPP